MLKKDLPPSTIKFFITFLWRRCLTTKCSNSSVNGCLQFNWVKLSRSSHIHTSWDFLEVLFNFLLPRGFWVSVMVFYCFLCCFFLGKGIPLKRAEQWRYDHVQDVLLPTVEQAVQWYLQSGANKTLTMESKFGEDPLVTEHQKELE